LRRFLGAAALVWLLVRSGEIVVARYENPYDCRDAAERAMHKEFDRIDRLYAPWGGKFAVRIMVSFHCRYTEE
jgi:hypothetical protein